MTGHRTPFSVTQNTFHNPRSNRNQSSHSPVNCESTNRKEGSVTPVIAAASALLHWSGRATHLRQTSAKEAQTTNSLNFHQCTARSFFRKEALCSAVKGISPHDCYGRPHQLQRVVHTPNSLGATALGEHIHSCLRLVLPSTTITTGAGTKTVALNCTEAIEKAEITDGISDSPKQISPISWPSISIF